MVASSLTKVSQAKSGDDVDENRTDELVQVVQRALQNTFNDAFGRMESKMDQMLSSISSSAQSSCATKDTEPRLAALEDTFPWVPQETIRSISDTSFRFRDLHKLDPRSVAKPHGDSEGGLRLFSDGERLVIKKDERQEHSKMHDALDFASCWTTYTMICNHLRPGIGDYLSMFLVHIIQLTTLYPWSAVAVYAQNVCDRRLSRPTSFDYKHWGDYDYNAVNSILIPQSLAQSPTLEGKPNSAAIGQSSTSTGTSQSRATAEITPSPLVFSNAEEAEKFVLKLPTEQRLQIIDRLALSAFKSQELRAQHFVDLFSTVDPDMAETQGASSGSVAPLKSSANRWVPLSTAKRPEPEEKLKPEQEQEQEVETVSEMMSTVTVAAANPFPNRFLNPHFPNNHFVGNQIATDTVANQIIVWTSLKKPRSIVTNSPEMIARKVTGLLNKLSSQNFEKISDDILVWANKNTHQAEGQTLSQVVQICFDKAVDEIVWAELYARLFRKMSRGIKAEVKDNRTRDSQDRPLTGGMLFRTYLLTRCQETFHRLWLLADPSSGTTVAFKPASEDGDVTEELYSASTSKRRRAGITRLAGELFKLRLLTERVMHDFIERAIRTCLAKLVENVDKPQDEDVSSLCELLVIVGPTLDSSKGRADMDTHFKQLDVLSKSVKVGRRVAFMVQDTIKLRSRNWEGRAALMSQSRLSANPTVPGTLTTSLQNNKKVPTHATAPEVDAKIDEHCKQLFIYRDLAQGESFFAELARENRHLFVSKLVSVAIESKEEDARLIADLFERVAEAEDKSRLQLIDQFTASNEKDNAGLMDLLERAGTKVPLCPSTEFEKGFLLVAELLDDTTIDAPHAPALFSMLMKAARLEEL